MPGFDALGSSPLGGSGGGGSAVASIATVNINAPVPQLVAAGRPSNSAMLLSPSASVVSYGGINIPPITAPSPSLYAVGHDASGDNAFIYTAPAPTLSAFGGANTNLTAPSPVLTVTATFMNFGAASLSAPAATVAATGTVAAVAGALLSAPMGSLIGYSGAVVSVTITGSPTVQATGTTGSTGGAAISAPLFELTASGTVNALSYANLVAPSPKLGAQAQAYIIAPRATLTAIGTAVVTATYEAYALNLNHTPRYSAGQPVKPTDELTHYTNFPFTQIVRYKNSYFGVADDALYLLEGTTDDGALIGWNVQTAFSDFDSPNLKTLNSAYFGGRFGPLTTISLLVSEANTEAYVYTTPLDDTAKNYRQAFGRGNKARYYAVGAEGTGEVTIDSINFNIATLARRI